VVTPSQFPCLFWFQVLRCGNDSIGIAAATPFHDDHCCVDNPEGLGLTMMKTSGLMMEVHPKLLTSWRNLRRRSTSPRWRRMLKRNERRRSRKQIGQTANRMRMILSMTRGTFRLFLWHKKSHKLDSHKNVYHFMQAKENVDRVSVNEVRFNYGSFFDVTQHLLLTFKCRLQVSLFSAVSDITNRSSETEHWWRTWHTVRLQAAPDRQHWRQNHKKGTIHCLSWRKCKKLIGK
jgi:hypothetical protein